MKFVTKFVNVALAIITASTLASVCAYATPAPVYVTVNYGESEELSVDIDCKTEKYTISETIPTLRKVEDAEEIGIRNLTPTGEYFEYEDRACPIYSGAWPGEDTRYYFYDDNNQRYFGLDVNLKEGDREICWYSCDSDWSSVGDPVSNSNTLTTPDNLAIGHHYYRCVVKNYNVVNNYKCSNDMPSLDARTDYDIIQDMGFVSVDYYYTNGNMYPVMRGYHDGNEVYYSWSPMAQKYYHMVALDTPELTTSIEQSIMFDVEIIESETETDTTTVTVTVTENETETETETETVAENENGIIDESTDINVVDEISENIQNGTTEGLVAPQTGDIGVITAISVMVASAIGIIVILFSRRRHK